RFTDVRAGGFPVPRVVFALGLELVGAVGHDLAVLGVNAQGELRVRSVIETLHAHAVVGEGQVADGLAEEDLVADHAGGGDGENIFGVGLHDDAGDAEIHQRLALHEFLLDLDLFRVGGRRNGVRHVDDGRNAAANGRGRTGGEVLFVCHAGLSKVDVAIEEPRQDMFAFDVDLLFTLRQLVIRADCDDLLAADRHPAFKCFRGRHYSAVLDK